MFNDLEIPLDGGLDVPLPRMAAVKQTFDATCLASVSDEIAAVLARPELIERVKPGMRVALGVGSRGVANVAEATAAIVAALKARGADPFIFPAMGSHGGATVEGQTGVLANYGVTAAQIGAPIRATMETVELGRMPDGTPVHMDRYAHEADGVVLVNRIKPHTTFRGAIESGVVKMLVIGMGKIKGATAIHGHGMDRFPEVLPKVAQFIMDRTNFLFGVGMIENAYDDTAVIEAMLPEELIEREMVLLSTAKKRMGRIFFNEFDVLVIDRMGKEISGAGFDPNITGRNSRGVTGFDDPKVTKIVVLGLSEQTHGNATGLGLADAIPRRLFDEIDFPATYANVITSAYLDGGVIPIVMSNEQEVIQLAVKTVPRVKPQDCRIVRIRDTLTLGEIEVSEPLLPLVNEHPNLEALETPRAWRFNDAGDVVR